MAQEVIRDYRRQQMARQQEERLGQDNAANLGRALHHTRHAFRYAHHALRQAHDGLMAPPPRQFWRLHHGTGVDGLNQGQIVPGERGVQVLDRESITTLLLFFFMDHEKLDLFDGNMTIETFILGLV